MKLKERLAHERLILDGGFGSMLTAAGLPTGTPTEQWNIQNPGAVEAVSFATFRPEVRSCAPIHSVQIR